MATTDKFTEEFLSGLKEAESILKELGFFPSSFKQKGYAYFIEYKRENTVVEFLFGPSGWDIEMIIYPSKGKFAFKDLLENPSIAQWVQDNRYTPRRPRDLKAELFWYLELLKYSLPLVE